MFKPLQDRRRVNATSRILTYILHSANTCICKCFFVLQGTVCQICCSFFPWLTYNLRAIDPDLRCLILIFGVLTYRSWSSVFNVAPKTSTPRTSAAGATAKPSSTKPAALTVSNVAASNAATTGTTRPKSGSQQFSFVWGLCGSSPQRVCKLWPAGLMWRAKLFHAAAKRSCY